MRSMLDEMNDFQQKNSSSSNDEPFVWTCSLQRMFWGEDKVFNLPSQTAYLVLTLHGGPVNSCHALMTFSLGNPRDPGGGNP